MSKSTTKERLLEAACSIFADKGFHDTTVAEICEAAEANIASVNYHFGDKETLYAEVWQCAFALASESYPIDGGQPETPEDYLHAFAYAVLHRIFSETPNGIFAKLLYREMASPTISLKKIATDYLLPQSQHLENIIQNMPGAPLDRQTLELCKHNIIAQCAFYNFSRPLRELMIGKQTIPEEEIDRIARHIARFSLGGLKEIQNNIQRRDAEAAE